MAFQDDFKTHYKMSGFELKLIYWNVGVFVLSILLFYQFKVAEFNYPNWLYLSSNISSVLHKPWTLLTYAFLHSSVGHLFFNMLVLNFSGRLFLSFFNYKQLLGLYILSAIFAGIVFVAIYNIFGMEGRIVGASGAIMAVLFATTAYMPMMNLRLLLIGNVKLWQLSAVLLGLDLLYLLAENTGGHVTHLAGAFVGFAYVKLLQSGTDLSAGVTLIFDKMATLRSRQKATPFKKVHRNYNIKSVKTSSKIISKDKTQQQIDEILDKISRSGYDSLTSDEKEFLFRAGK